VISSSVGIFFVRTDEQSDPQKALNKGMTASAVLLALGAFGLTYGWYGNLHFFWAVLSGLLSGIVVGYVAQYYTSGKAVKTIAEASQTGPATVIIQGTAIGMKSTALPVIGVALATIISYNVAGVFGIALSAIGMLAITGMTVAVDAYGPIADNAAGIAEMAGMGPEVRKRAEKLDAIGNTTAAIGKGFAIGSAALTALALFVAYGQAVKLTILNAVESHVVAGLFIGAIVPFLFCAMTMQAVGRSAFSIVEEVRRQFKEIPGLMEGKVMPDSARCVDITTKGALKEMMLPGIMAVLFPLVLGILLGKEALGGFLVGSLITGVPLAIMLANSGGAWDNAKKYIEEGNLGGKGSPAHKASVVGDTVGDPFKDTSGPSLNILLKLMAVVSLVFAPLIVELHATVVSLFF
jgi:K(+)-stimulated pyrophosphate-energized sodium pump